MSKIKVLIADDHVLVREGIAAFLKTCDDIEVVAEASDGIEAIEKTGRQWWKTLTKSSQTGKSRS